MTRRRRRPLLMDHTLTVGRRSTPDIVYAFRFPSRPGALKVGTSSRGLARVREQTTGYPEAPEVVLVFHHRDAKRIERALHDALSSKQMHGTVGTEWFRAGLEDLVAASPELRAAMGRQLWRSGARWAVAGLGVVVWASVLPLWLALFAKDGLDAVRRVVGLWSDAPWSAVSGVAASLRDLLTGAVGLDAAVLPVVVLAAWMWWVVLRR